MCDKQHGVKIPLVLQTDCHNMWQAAVVLLLVFEVPCRTYELQAILKRCHVEQRFATLLLMQHQQQLPCQQLQQVAATTEWPVFWFNNQADFYLKSSQSTEILALFCVIGDYTLDTEMWQAVSRNLYNMRDVRVLLVLPKEVASVAEVLQELTVIATELHLPNVALTTSSKGIYRLQPYLQNSWLKLNLSNGNTLYETQPNYQQKVAYTLPDQIRSFSLVYMDKKTREMKMSGFVARLIQEFARVYNISLHWRHPVILGEKLSIIQLRNMTINGTLNLPITLCGYEELNKAAIFSYPYDIPSWFIMVPCAQEVSTAEVFQMLFNWKMLVLLLVSYFLYIVLDCALSCLLMREKFDWTYLLCNERMIAAILGQSSKLWSRYTITSRMSQAQLFIVGLMISTVFAAHLKTLLTKRPTERQISTLPDLGTSKLKIYFEHTEQFYVSRMFDSYPIKLIKDKIEYVPSNEFYDMRQSLTVPDGFSITETEFNMIRRQQELFYRPAFCLFSDLIFRHNLLMSVPLEPNSIYAQHLDSFIHQIHASGLFLYWKAESIRDLIALGQINLKDPQVYETLHAFNVADLLIVWLNLCLGLTIACAVFICEIILNRWQQKLMENKSKGCHKT